MPKPVNEDNTRFSVSQLKPVEEDEEESESSFARECDEIVDSFDKGNMEDKER